LAERPLLSVVIPAYNGESFLAEAVESIYSQDYHPLEIIIVDDASTDNTAGVARSFMGDLRGEVRYLYQAHFGRPAAGRNRGIKASAGAIIGFLDQDDIWPEYKLALQVPYLLNDDDPLDVVLGHTQVLHLAEPINGVRKFEATTEPVDYMLLSSALFKRPVFEKVGCFDETLQYYGDDLDWFIRAREQGLSIRQLEKVTLYWRIHEANTSHDPTIRDHERGYDRALTEIIKKKLDRRRKPK
jgi:glycosyltransferase involved in cell wall biosynthesis